MSSSLVFNEQLFITRNIENSSDERSKQYLHNLFKFSLFFIIIVLEILRMFNYFIDSIHKIIKSLFSSTIEIHDSLFISKLSSQFAFLIYQNVLF